MNTQWTGKKVAVLGDSLSERNEASIKYWQILQDELGIEPFVYAVSGWYWKGVRVQAKMLKRERGTDIDAIFIFMGTNDFNKCVPIGKWWDHEEVQANYNGTVRTVRKRVPDMDDSTLCGSINKNMAFLKANYPEQQIILFTPIHRGYAVFDASNIQPDETHPNQSGLYMDEYVRIIREAADIWSVPLIDLYRDSGLLPVLPEHIPYFTNAETDRLHPNNAGHKRLAETLKYELLKLPATFR